MPIAIVCGRRIEYRMIAAYAPAPPALVFLHEGLGSAALWRDFPDQLAARIGARALVYSRFGYGRSDGLLARRTPHFMHQEALQYLPSLLDQLGIVRPVLIGHSDGASIALIHAAASERPVAALVLIAPHVFVETITLESIAGMRQAYLSTDLRKRLAKYHSHVDDAFLGWSDAWLAPAFRRWSIEELLPRVIAPALLIQGLADEYGTLSQLDRIETGMRGQTERLVLKGCGHSAHRDCEGVVVEAIASFLQRQNI